MRILFAASEVQPLIKTGGLADVAGHLPPALLAQGEDVRIVMPAYRVALAALASFETVAELFLLGAAQPVEILQATLPGTKVSIYLVSCPHYFDREGGPYADSEGRDWEDNAARFTLFARAVVELAQNRAGLEWQPELVHCNDWQTGLIPALLKREVSAPKTLFTIHNLAYQGLFSWHEFQALQLPRDLWSMEGMEFYGHFSFMKGGLVYADHLNTVSPQYAKEILTPEYGYGLEGLLQSRADVLSGILNGVEYDVWDPEHDELIPFNYGVHSLEIKAENKRALQREYHLSEEADTPLIVYVGRLADQKGVDLILSGLPSMVEHLGMQVLLLGSGRRDLEEALWAVGDRYPGRVATYVGFSEDRVHRIKAGADMFLMPSRFEPCGLNQIYSLRYGTVPIVRAVGGLVNTVVDVSLESLAAGRASGFHFSSANAGDMLYSVGRACELYREQTAVWRTLMLNGMQQDFSWQQGAGHYCDLYRQIVGQKKAQS